MEARHHVFAAFLVCLLASVAFAQNRYVDSVHHWSLDIPSGWEAASAEDVDLLTEELDERLPRRDFEFIAMFWQSDPTEDAPPYVIVQFTALPLRGASLDDIEQAFGVKAAADWQERAVREVAEAGIAAVDFTTPVFDHAGRRVFMDLNVTGPDGETWKGRCVMHLAAHGTIQINFYSPPETFESNLVHLDAFLDAFRVDPRFQWVPATVDRRKSGWSRTLERAIAGAVGGAMLGLIGAVWAWCRKPRLRIGSEEAEDQWWEAQLTLYALPDTAESKRERRELYQRLNKLETVIGSERAAALTNELSERIASGEWGRRGPVVVPTGT